MCSPRPPPPTPRRFLFTSEAQAEFGKVGFRLNPKLAKQAAAQQQLPPAKLWSVDKELGGWTKAQVKFFDAGGMGGGAGRGGAGLLAAGCWCHMWSCAACCVWQ